MTRAQTNTQTDWRRLLMGIPHRNSAARPEEEKQHRVSVAIATVKPWYLRLPPLSWIVPVHASRRVVLDGLGTQVWQLCDGNRTVEQVVDEFASRHRLTFHEARVSVTSYIKMLVQRGAMAMVLPEDDAQ